MDIQTVSNQLLPDVSPEDRIPILSWVLNRCISYNIPIASMIPIIRPIKPTYTILPQKTSSTIGPIQPQPQLITSAIEPQPIAQDIGPISIDNYVQYIKSHTGINVDQYRDNIIYYSCTQDPEAFFNVPQDVVSAITNNSYNAFTVIDMRVHLNLYSQYVIDKYGVSHAELRSRIEDLDASAIDNYIDDVHLQIYVDHTVDDNIIISFIEVLPDYLEHPYIMNSYSLGLITHIIHNDNRFYDNLKKLIKFTMKFLCYE